MFELLLAIHLFYDQSCCGGKDCHPVPCEEITSLSDGWIWQGKTFHRIMFHESPDGQCHVCVDVVPRCIYLPSRV